MKEIKAAAARLLKVKSIVTLGVTVGLLVGFLRGDISPEQFMTVAAMVFTFYFARREGASEEGKEHE